MNKRQSERCKCKEIDKTFEFWNFSKNLEYDTPSEVGWVICVQICGVLMFSLICAWINRWVNNGGPGDLRHFGATGAIHSNAKVVIMTNLGSSTTGNYVDANFIVTDDTWGCRHDNQTPMTPKLAPWIIVIVIITTTITTITITIIMV